MSGKNQIIKLGLEARANRLRSSIEPLYSVRDIARILTEESGKKVNFQSVQRYFSANFSKVDQTARAAAAAAIPKPPDPIIQAVQARTEVITAAVNGRLDAVAQLQQVNQDTLDILTAAKGDVDKGVKSNPGLALAAIQRIEKQLELQAKLLGDLPTGPTVNVTVIEGQFTEFRNIILEVTCPDCRARIADRLNQVLGQ